MKLSQLNNEELNHYLKDCYGGTEEYEDKKVKNMKLQTLDSLIGVLKKTLSRLECCKSALIDNNISSLKSNIPQINASLLNSYRRIQNIFPALDVKDYDDNSENIDILFEERERNVLYIRIPERLPERITKNGHYYSNVVNRRYQKAFEKEFQNKRHCIYDTKVVIYILTHYAKEQELKDHDNLESKQMIDLIANYLLIDDGPKFCAHYMDYCMDDNTFTEIYVIPQTYFIEFCKNI